MTYANVISAIVAAIAALALLIPGLDALESSLRRLQESKVAEATEQCYAIVAREKTKLNQVDAAQTACVQRLSNEINKNFATALDMIATFRQTVLLQQASAAASAASGATSTASGT